MSRRRRSRRASEAAGLCSILGLLSEPPQPRTVEILAQGDRRSHGEPPSGCHSASDFRQPGNAHQSRFALAGFRLVLTLLPCTSASVIGPLRRGSSRGHPCPTKDPSSKPPITPPNRWPSPAKGYALRSNRRRGKCRPRLDFEHLCRVHPHHSGAASTTRHPTALRLGRRAARQGWAELPASVLCYLCVRYPFGYPFSELGVDCPNASSVALSRYARCG